MKKCSKCQIEKSLDCFTKNKAMKSGLDHYCKDCKKVQNKKYYKIENQEKWRKNNQEKIKERRKNNSEFHKNYSKEWRKKNVEHTKSYRKIYRMENKEILKEKHIIYYSNDENKEKKRLYNKNLRKRKPEVFTETLTRRRLKVKQATPKWANKKKILQFYKQAQDLTRKGNEKYVVDHIVPINSKLVCGLHNEFNLQVLSYVENCKKSNKFIPLHQFSF